RLYIKIDKARRWLDPAHPVEKSPFSHKEAPASPCKLFDLRPYQFVLFKASPLYKPREYLRLIQDSRKHERQHYHRNSKSNASRQRRDAGFRLPRRHQYSRDEDRKKGRAGEAVVA